MLSGYKLGRTSLLTEQQQQQQQQQYQPPTQAQNTIINQYLDVSGMVSTEIQHSIKWPFVSDGFLQRTGTSKKVASVTLDELHVWLYSFTRIPVPISSI